MKSYNGLVPSIRLPLSRTSINFDRCSCVDMPEDANSNAHVAQYMGLSVFDV
ncbi:MAG: hypothetical protein K6G44_00180 [Lentisphaeria bacterium]|nr:hypothetical protein [Lentisphaeria bacterium]